MKTLVARLMAGLSKVGRPEIGRRKIVREEDRLIAVGREQFQRLLDKGLSIPIASV